MMMNNNENQHDEGEEHEFVDQQQRRESSSSNRDDDDGSSSSNSQPKKKRIKLEEGEETEEEASASASAGNNLERRFTGLAAGNPNSNNMPALGSMAATAAYHPPTTFDTNNNSQNFSLAYGAGLPPMASLVGQTFHTNVNFPGTSPALGHSHSNLHNQHFFGYGGLPGLTTAAAAGVAAAASTNGGGEDADSDTELGSDQGGGGTAAGATLLSANQISAGMPPLFFPANNPMLAARGGLAFGGHHDGTTTTSNFYHPPPAVLQVVSTDSQENHGSNSLFPARGGVVTLQEPRKWVRWSDHEDQMLRSAVAQWGENNFRHISEQVFHGTRTEAQCKTRWKKGSWTREEDNIVKQCVEAGNMNWPEIAKRLPGRIGEQVKDRWVSELDPNVKKGVWTEAEMVLLRDAQKELGNKWSEIAKRIPGRSEQQTKNRWYNAKTSERRAQKKREAEAEAEKQATLAISELKARHTEEEEDESSPQQMDAAMSHPPLPGQQSGLLYGMYGDGEEQEI